MIKTEKRLYSFNKDNNLWCLKISYIDSDYITKLEFTSLYGLIKYTYHELYTIDDEIENIDMILFVKTYVPEIDKVKIRTIRYNLDILEGEYHRFDNLFGNDDIYYNWEDLFDMLLEDVIDIEEYVENII